MVPLILVDVNIQYKDISVPSPHPSKGREQSQVDPKKIVFHNESSYVHK
jgi:hypothetical protein